MDTDLPPFSSGHFDLIVLSHVLEYRSTPLALLSLTYEVLASHGLLVCLVPHRLGAKALYLDWRTVCGHGFDHTFPRPHFSPLGHRAARDGAVPIPW